MERERGPVDGELSNRRYWIHPRRRPWSRAVQAGLAGFDAERHGIFFLDLECPLARLPHSSYAYRSPGHRHLPGGPDLANAVLMRFLERVSK